MINKSIKKLDVSDTNIGDEGVISIVDAILKNSSSVIELINFYHVGMTNEGAKKCLELAKNKDSIMAMNIRGNNIDKTLKKQVYDYLEEKRPKQYVVDYIF